MHIQKQSIIKYLSNERQNSHYKKTTFSPQKQTLQGSELATATVLEAPALRGQMCPAPTRSIRRSAISFVTSHVLADITTRLSDPGNTLKGEMVKYLSILTRNTQTSHKLDPVRLLCLLVHREANVAI